jgi:hypothetical protein
MANASAPKRPVTAAGCVILHKGRAITQNDNWEMTMNPEPAREVRRNGKDLFAGWTSTARPELVSTAIGRGSCVMRSRAAPPGTPLLNQQVVNA